MKRKLLLIHLTSLTVITISLYLSFHFDDSISFISMLLYSVILVSGWILQTTLYFMKRDVLDKKKLTIELVVFFIIFTIWYIGKRI